MDALNDYLKNVAKYRPCYFYPIEEAVGVALLTAIISEMQRLGYKAGELLLFNQKKFNRHRHSGFIKEQIKGIRYDHAQKKSEDLSSISIEGEYYRLTEIYEDEPFDNCRELQICHRDILEAIYNHLRLNRKSNSLQKKA